MNPADNPQTADAAIQRIQDLPESTPRSIAIIGAGIAGLVAAEQLTAKGHEVAVIEASERIGGRILTHKYGDTHAELGGMRIPAKSNSTLRYCKALNLELEDFYNSDANTFYRIRGKTVPQQDPKELLDLFQFDMLDRQMLNKDPTALFSSLGTQLTASLTLQDLHAIETGTVADARDRVRELENVTVRDYFLRHTRNREAVEYVAAVHYLDDVWMCSCASLIREFLRSAGNNRLHQIVIGMEALPYALHEHIKDRTNLHWQMATPVIGLETHNKHVLVTTKDATQQFDQVLCTIPLPVLNTMNLIGLSPAKRAAIQHFRYAASTKVLINFKERFWNTGANVILGGISVSDELIGQLVYPSEPHVAPSNGKQGLPLQFPTPVLATEQNPRTMPDPKTPTQGILMSYTWGDRARRLGGLSHEDRLNVVLEGIANIHGRDILALADGGATMAWEKNRWSLSAFSQPGIRGLQLYLSDASRPEGALYFCGEHLSSNPGWIHGSIDSALASVEQMLAETA